MSCITACACNYTMSNVGINDCNPLLRVTKRLILVPTLDSSGAQNHLSLSAFASYNAAYFVAKVNETDTSKRWQPLTAFTDVDDKRNEPVTKTLSDDTEIFIKDGVRKFTAMVWGAKATPILKGLVESARCLSVSAFLVDLGGNLIGGSVSSDGTKLYPFQLDSESLSAMYVNAKDKDVTGLQISFNFSQDENDSCIRMVKSTELGGALLLGLRPMQDVFSTVSGISTTGATIAMWTKSMNPLNNVVLPGLVTADFISSVGGATSKVRNTTDAADVAVTVTESTVTPGTYVLAWTAQTVSDVIVVKCLKSNFDFANVVSNYITIV